MSTLSADPASRRRRALDSLEGLSVGDAFGERFFLSPPVVERMISARELPKGPWKYTDDTMMSISIVEMLCRREAIDQDELVQAFAARFDPMRGYAGGATRLLRAVREGGSWKMLAAGLFGGQGSLGNGGAMRTAPLGAYFADDLDALREEARKSAEVTHAHPDGQAGAVAVALAAAVMLREPRDQGVAELLASVAEFTPPGATQEGIRRAAGLPDSASTALAASTLGTGRNVSSADTVPFSLWCAFRYRDSYEEALWQTVSGLGDRDTTCAIVGGLVVLSTGPSAIPAAWLSAREALPPI